MQAETNAVRISERPERVVGLEVLGGTLAGLRLCDDEAIRRMRDSLLRQGQLMALMVFGQGDLLEVVDGFKRLRAAQQLGWRMLRVRELEVDKVGAKAALMVLNAGHGLTELEEAWLVRALYRTDRLGQPQIARLLFRDKSWVSRRLLLAEGLDETVAADVRLGLLGSGAATAVARLPRGNQRAMTDLAMKQGMTRQQVERQVTDLLGRPAEERATVLTQMLARAQVQVAGGTESKGQPRPRTQGEWIVVDIATITRVCARLQARLWQQPLCTLGEAAARLTADGLLGLRPVLGALERAIARATEMDRRSDANPNE
jgi:ParB-like chromosome segregation protein Spo0J